jgi:hypothetical protein
MFFLVLPHIPTDLRSTAPVENGLQVEKMSMMIQVGAMMALLSVSLGAFGAHALKNYFSAEKIEIWEIGVKYQVNPNNIYNISDVSQPCPFILWIIF